MTRALFEHHDLSDKRRVIAVGDVHGRFDLLERNLNDLGFEPNLDVVILLGDLVDRGEGSKYALDWCDRPGIMRVRGNHDQLLHDIAFDEMPDLEHHRRCGGEWFAAIEDTEVRKRWGLKLTDCPIAIEAIVPGGQRFGFVHADVPVDDWNDLEGAIADSDPERMFSMAWRCMWTRDRVNDLRAYVKRHDRAAGHDCSIGGIDHVFFGHTILAAPVTHCNCTWIDTGAYATDVLTVMVVAQNEAFSRVSSGPLGHQRAA